MTETKPKTIFVTGQDNMGDFIRYLSMKKPVYGVIFYEGWFDIGSKEQLIEADLKYGGKGEYG